MLSEKPWDPMRVFRLLIAFVASLLLGILVVQGYASGFAQEGAKPEVTIPVMILGTITYQGVALVMIGVFLRIHRTSWADAFGFNSPKLVRTIVLSVLTCIIVLPIAWSLGKLSELVLTRLGANPVPQQSVQALQNSISFEEQLYFGLTAIFIAPVIEEMIFRGIMYPTLKQVGLARFALWSTSLFFALTHNNAVTFVPLLVLAVILTLLYETTNNLLAPILTHALFNAANFYALLRQS